MKNRVVITGIGPVSALGIGKKEFFSNLLDLKNISVPVKESFLKTYKLKSKFYVPTPAIDYSTYNFYSSLRRDTPENARLSLLAAHLALEDANFTVLDKNAAVIWGTGIVNLEVPIAAYQANITGTRFNRMTIPSTMTNAPAAWISIINGLHGDSYTINTACASSTYAIGEGFRKIRSGYADVVITGGVELLREDSGGIMRGFDVLTTLSKSNDGNPMPFSNARSGFLFNEGSACCLILENYESALRRNAHIYAEVSNYSANSDANNIIVMEPTGNYIKLLLEDLINSEKIDYYNAHGTGTILNDNIEAKVIQDLFGDKETQPYINSTKGILGHSIGASGAIEAAVCALSIDLSIIHGNRIYDPIDNLNLPLNTVSCEVKSAISTSFGFGGHNAGLLFKKIKY